MRLVKLEAGEYRTPDNLCRIYRVQFTGEWDAPSGDPVWLVEQRLSTDSDVWAEIAEYPTLSKGRDALAQHLARRR
jgi:hypothetical protein